MRVKTAISLPEDLFTEVDRLTKVIGVPRSRVVVMALEAFLEQKRLAALNQAYAEDLTEEERRQLAAFKRLQRKRMGSW